MTNGARGLHAGYLRLQTHTRGICNIDAFPLQKWMHEHASPSRDTYTVSLVAGLDDTLSLRGTGTENRSIKGVHHISCFPCLKKEAQPACETPASLKIRRVTK